MQDLIVFVVLLSLGYFAGSVAESRHYRSIKRRERELLNLPAVTAADFLDEGAEVVDARLVHGSVVISIDYFKRILAGLRNLFGGEVNSYLTLIDRARREAVLRMKEEAGGADVILNLRIETSVIGRNADRRKTVGSIEVMAYGTAVTLKRG
ncbi:MAG TPA: heavy metal-binding domain-containing protein [Nitrospirae bacterium]|nr:heavy metal-binding domain-containing protein [Nitrospirota bacterium]